MTIRRRRPLLYYLLLIILLQRSTRMGAGAVLYLHGNNYGDVFYQDMNYYDTFANPEKDVGTADFVQTLTHQGPIDDAQIDGEQADPVQQLNSLQSDAQQYQDSDEQERLSDIEKAEQLGMTDEEAAQRKREASEGANAPHQDEEQKAAYTCHAQTPAQQASLDAAVKDTKDTIEHVTTLIKRMREHAVAIVKEINELEGDFLGACQDERPKPSGPRKPSVTKGSCKAPFGIRQEDDSGGGGGYIDGTGGFKRIENEEDNNNYNNNQNKVIYLSNNQNSNGNRNDNENTNNPTAFNGQRGGDNSNEGGGNNQNANTNTNTKPNSKGAPTKPRILVNEFAMPIKTDTSDLPANEFIEQAQHAVHAWKHQIEECKRLLDEAMLHAVQQQSTDSADSPNTSVQHIIKIVKAPEEAEGLREDDAAPAAAASITPVRSTKEATSNSANINNNNNINNENPGGLKAIGNIVAALKSGNKNDDKLPISGDRSKAVHGENNNDADTDINDSTNNKRNDDSKKCRSENGEKKHRAIPPLLSVLQGMGF